jgi:hypothetical protein
MFRSLLVLLVAASSLSAHEGELARPSCGGALVYDVPAPSLSAASLLWRARQWRLRAPNSPENVAARARAFLGRLPKADYSRLTFSPKPLQYFLEQVGQFDFRQGEPLVYVRHDVPTEWWFGGWVPVRRLYETKPRSLPLAPVLVDGWRRLGLVRADGQFDFSLSPSVIASRFFQLTGYEVRRRPLTQKGSEKVLEERRDSFRQGVLVADDALDYLFVMPLLTSPEARLLFQRYAGYTAEDLAGLFGGLASDWRTQGSPELFLRFMSQSRTSETGAIFSGGPLVIRPEDGRKTRGEIAQRIEALVTWLAQPDEKLMIGHAPKKDIFYVCVGAAMQVRDDLVPERLEDWLAIAVADSLYRVGGVADDLGGFSPDALAFARERASLLHRYFSGDAARIEWPVPALDRLSPQLPPVATPNTAPRQR